MTPKEIMARVTDERAMDAMVAVRREGGENVFYCCVCSKGYKRKHFAAKHVVETLETQFAAPKGVTMGLHAAAFKQKKAELQAAALNKALAGYEHGFMRDFERIQANADEYEKTKVVFMARFNVNPREALKWNAERLVAAQAKAALAAEMEQLRSRSPATGDCTRAYFERFIEWYEDKVNGIIADPPTHNSTCAMSNIIKIFEHDAVCSVFDRVSGLGSMFAAAKAWLEISEFMEGNGIEVE